MRTADQASVSGRRAVLFLSAAPAPAAGACLALVCASWVQDCLNCRALDSRGQVSAGKACTAVSSWVLHQCRTTYCAGGVQVVLRKLFERLGSTYIKLGQFIASSPTLCALVLSAALLW